MRGIVKGGLNDGGSNIKSIQRGFIQLDNGGASPYTNSITISAVDLTKAIIKITVNGNDPDNTYYTVERHCVKASLTNATTLALYLTAATISPYCPSVSWEVIEFNNVKSLQKGTTAMAGTLGSVNQTIAAIDMAKTIIFFSHSMTGPAGNLLYQNVSCVLASTTQLTFRRLILASVSNSIYWFAVEFE